MGRAMFSIDKDMLVGLLRLPEGTTLCEVYCADNPARPRIIMEVEHADLPEPICTEALRKVAHCEPQYHYPNGLFTGWGNVSFD